MAMNLISLSSKLPSLSSSSLPTMSSSSSSSSSSPRLCLHNSVRYHHNGHDSARSCINLDNFLRLQNFLSRRQLTPVLDAIDQKQLLPTENFLFSSSLELKSPTTSKLRVAFLRSNTASDSILGIIISRLSSPSI